MVLGINLFGAQNTKEAQKENSKEMVREWQSKMRSEARGVDRTIRQIERDEEKIKKDIKKMAKEGSDPKNILTLTKSLVRSNKAKGRLYNSRSAMMAASQEMQNIAATMRMGDVMKKSTEVMQQVNTLVNIPELQESMQSMAKEMRLAGFIDEMIDEGIEDMDGAEIEDEAVAEVDQILADLAIDAAVRMAVAPPAQVEAARAAAAPATGGYTAAAAPAAPAHVAAAAS